MCESQLCRNPPSTFIDQTATGATTAGNISHQTTAGAISDHCWRYLRPLLALSQTTAGTMRDHCWRYLKPLLALCETTCLLYTSPSPRD